MIIPSCKDHCVLILCTSFQGWIPLHLALISGHTSVVSLLLAKSSHQLNIKDNQGRTGLHLAAANGHLDIVTLLLGQGAEVDVVDNVSHHSFYEMILFDLVCNTTAITIVNRLFRRAGVFRMNQQLLRNDII